MFGKVKKWLGIEGVKLELIIPEEINRTDGLIPGKIQFYSMNSQTVNYIKVVLIERYSRGRRKEKLTDEYELGAIQIEQTIDIPENEIIEVDFMLPFSLVRSDIDEFGDRNFLFGGIAAAARALNGVKSEYRIEAEAKVKGTALNPFDKKEIRIK